ncbi:hypothetical protein [Geobacter sp. AOG2]|uniref:hypothetical protein n=1 Tax=Geobacter sp. AOG2 TaxID=1566347 RepID=UPI001CC38323|nr:hypothetical protein [Geobacter sp. AOG2]GFE61522.1 hypothetical protein AOG2_21090 [Geobacter sp. AOG2]
MKSYCLQILVVLSVLSLLGGCGGSNGSSNYSVGSTVSLHSSVTSGSSPAVTTSASDLNDYAGMDFTLTSAILGTVTGTFVASTISVPTYTVSYSYVSNSINDTHQYPIPGFTLATGGSISAGGTLEYTGTPIIKPEVKNYIQTNYPSVFSNYSSNVLTYTAHVTFNGIEDTTNKSLSSTTDVTLFITK